MRVTDMKCKYNDCGWCYCKSGKSNDENGQCNKPEDCEENKEEGGPIDGQ